MRAVQGDIMETQTLRPQNTAIEEMAAAVAAKLSPNLETVPRPHRVGRKKRMGSVTFVDGNLRWHLGYCDQGHAVSVDRHYIDALKINIKKSQRSLLYRLLRRIMAHYEK